MDKLEFVVGTLAITRMDLAHQLAEKERLLEELRLTNIGQELSLLDEEIKRTQASIAIDEQNVRVQALQVYDGETKKVHPAVTVKSFQVVEYAPGDMIEYAIEHDMPALLQLNKKNVTALIKSGAGPKFAEIYPEDRVTIAKDLSDYV